MKLQRFFLETWHWWVATAVVVVLGAFFAGGLKTEVASVADGATSLTKAIRNPESAPPAGTAGTEAERSSGAPAASDAAKLSVAQAGSATAGHSARQMKRTASLTLIVGDVDRAVQTIGTAARQAGGDVVKLDDERPEDPHDGRTAELQLSVPQDRFDSTVARIAQVGGVRSRTISAEDVGDQLVDDRARLRNLRRTEADMLAIMDRSGKIGEVLEVENQLSSVRDQIERLDAETQALGAQVAMSTIDVSLETEATYPSAEPSIASQLSQAWISAWRASRDAAVGLLGRAFLLLAFAPYWLVLIGIGFLIVTLLRRYRARTQAAHG